MRNTQGIGVVKLPSGYRGYFNQSDEMLFKFSCIEAYNFVDHVGLARIWANDGKDWMYINGDGKQAFDARFKEARDFGAHGVKDWAVVQLENDYWCFIDKDGRNAMGSGFEFKSLSSFCDRGLAKVQFANDEWGFITKDGSNAFGNARFKEIGDSKRVSSSDDYLTSVVFLNGNVGFVHENEEKIVEIPDSKGFQNFNGFIHSSGLMIVELNPTDEIARAIIVDKTGENVFGDKEFYTVLPQNGSAWAEWYIGKGDDRYLATGVVDLSRKLYSPAFKSADIDDIARGGPVRVVFLPKGKEGYLASTDDGFKLSLDKEGKILCDETGKKLK